MRIHVTQEDIDNGGRNGSNCPIALAVRRQVPSLGDAVIGGAAVLKMGSEALTVAATLTSRARAFIRRNDNFGDTRPFSFDLDVPAALKEEKVQE